MTPEDIDQLRELLRENGDADEAADFAQRVMTAVNETMRLRGQSAAAEIVFQKMRAERDSAEQALTERGTDLDAALAHCVRLEARQQELLATIARLSATTPYADEIAGWESQRAVMLAEVGSLRSALRAAEAVRDDARRVSQRYLDDKREALHHLLNLLARVHRDGGHYTERHGLAKAVADADLRIAALNCLADEAQKAK